MNARDWFFPALSDTTHPHCSLTNNEHLLVPGTALSFGTELNETCGSHRVHCSGPCPFLHLNIYFRSNPGKER